MAKQPKTFVVGTYRTTPFHYKPPPPAVFPKNPLYENVQSKVAAYIAAPAVALLTTNTNIVNQ